MNERLYDPQLGRFLSPDPIVAAPFYCICRDADDWQHEERRRNIMSFSTIDKWLVTPAKSTSLR